MRLNWERNSDHHAWRQFRSLVVVSDNVNGSCGTFKVVAPNAEHFIDSEELLVMDIVV